MNFNRKKRASIGRGQGKGNLKNKTSAIEQSGLFTVSFIHLACGCAFSYVSSVIPIARRLLRTSMTVVTLPLQLGLFDLSFFVGDIPRASSHKLLYHWY